MCVMMMTTRVHSFSVYMSAWSSRDYAGLRCRAVPSGSFASETRLLTEVLSRSGKRSRTDRRFREPMQMGDDVKYLIIVNPIMRPIQIVARTQCDMGESH